jgi:hypothetical protein
VEGQGTGVFTPRFWGNTRMVEDGHVAGRFCVTFIMWMVKVGWSGGVSLCEWTKHTWYTL